VTDVTGAAATSRIRAAAALDRTDLEALFAHRITATETLSFDPASGSVRARRIRQLDALRLADDPVPVTDLEQAALLLAEAALRRPETLTWTKEQKALRARAVYLRQTLGDVWPDLSDAALAADPAWLAPHILGETRLAAITAAHLGNALDLLLPWSQRQEIDRLLPATSLPPPAATCPSTTPPKTARRWRCGCRNFSASIATPPWPAARCPCFLSCSPRPIVRSKPRVICPASGAAAGKTWPRTSRAAIPATSGRMTL
jgi:HrpA-like RNA helicase